MMNASVFRLGLTALFCAASAAHAAQLTLHDCRLESAGAGGGAAARCGELVVRENRIDPASRSIKLRVAVVPALRLEPQRDPLVILSGGPGQAASDFYLSVAPAFARIRRDRDIVLVDQRGTGASNRLDCEWPDDSELLETRPGEVQAAARACLSKLPGDPRFYTTSIAVRDLEAVRIALGYERFNLYGASYGTRVAQHYMRRHPDRVRTAILDGVAPPDAPLGPDTPLLVQQTLDAVFDRCAREARCAERFPQLAMRFQALRTELTQRPQRLALTHPLTAAPTTVLFGPAQLSAAVRLLSYTDETAALLPLLIDEAQQHARPQALAAQYLMVRDALDRQLAQGMHFSVVCSEDGPHWSSMPIDQAAVGRTYLGPAFMQAMQAVCEVWPRGPVDADFHEPLRTRTPVLLLSGADDPATPPSYAARVLPGFARAEHVVLEGQGHGQIGAGCVPKLAAQFISQGDLQSIDFSCTRAVTPAPFMLSASASAP